MAEQYANDLLRLSLAQLCHNHGFSSVSSQPFDILLDIYRRALDGVVADLRPLCDHFSRREPVLDDVGVAFHKRGLSDRNLADYLQQVGPLSFPHKVPPFPVKRHLSKPLYAKTSDAELAVRPDYIPPYFPPCHPELANGKTQGQASPIKSPARIGIRRSTTVEGSSRSKADSRNDLPDFSDLNGFELGLVRSVPKPKPKPKPKPPPSPPPKVEVIVSDSKKSQSVTLVLPPAPQPAAPTPVVTVNLPPPPPVKPQTETIILEEPEPGEIIDDEVIPLHDKSIEDIIQEVVGQSRQSPVVRTESPVVVVKEPEPTKPATPPPSVDAERRKLVTDKMQKIYDKSILKEKLEAQRRKKKQKELDKQKEVEKQKALYDRLVKNPAFKTIKKKPVPPPPAARAPTLFDPKSAHVIPSISEIPQVPLAQKEQIRNKTTAAIITEKPKEKPSHKHKHKKNHLFVKFKKPVKQPPSEETVKQAPSEEKPKKDKEKVREHKEKKKKKKKDKEKKEKRERKEKEKERRLAGHSPVPAVAEEPVPAPSAPIKLTIRLPPKPVEPTPEPTPPEPIEKKPNVVTPFKIKIPKPFQEPKVEPDLYQSPPPASPRPATPSLGSSSPEATPSPQPFPDDIISDYNTPVKSPRAPEISPPRIERAIEAVKTEDLLSPKKEESEVVWVCPECGVAYEIDTDNMIGCDGCDNWFHWTCVGMLQEPPKHQKWFCKNCSERLGKKVVIQVNKYKRKTTGGAKRGRKKMKFTT